MSRDPLTGAYTTPLGFAPLGANDPSPIWSFPLLFSNSPIPGYNPSAPHLSTFPPISSQEIYDSLNPFSNLPPITPEMQRDIYDALTPFDGTPASRNNLAETQATITLAFDNPFAPIHTISGGIAAEREIINDVFQHENAWQTFDSSFGVNQDLIVSLFG